MSDSYEIIPHSPTIDETTVVCRPSGLVIVMETVALGRLVFDAWDGLV